MDQVKKRRIEEVAGVGLITAYKDDNGAFCIWHGDGPILWSKTQHPGVRGVPQHCND